MDKSLLLAFFRCVIIFLLFLQIADKRRLRLNRFPHFRMVFSNRIFIEYIQNSAPANIEEMVVLFNGSNIRTNLNGWRVVYHKNDSHIFTYNFISLRGTFDPGERLCLISGDGLNRFVYPGRERSMPVAHWDIYTDYPVKIMNCQHVTVELFDNTQQRRDAMSVIRENIHKEKIHQKEEGMSKKNVFNIGNVGALNVDSPESHVQANMNVLTDEKLLVNVLQELKKLRDELVSHQEQYVNNEIAVIDGVLAEAPNNPKSLSRIQSIGSFLMDHVDKIGTTLVAALIKGELGI